jgi:hypothetical protein
MTKNDAVFTWILTPEYFDVEDFATSHMSRVEMMQMLDNINDLKAHVVGKIEADIEMARLCDMPLNIRRMDFSLPE